MSLMTLEELRDSGSSRNWWRPQVREWLKTLSPAQMREDQALIDLVQARAQRSNIAQSALEWAGQHDVAVVIDHALPADQARGVYLPGAGVCLLPEQVVFDERTIKEFSDIRSLTHEIRHARQDLEGLLPSWPWDAYVAQGNVIHSIKQTALLEADACMHELGVWYEAKWKKPATANILRREFLRYYSLSTRAPYYFNVGLNHHGAVLGLPWAQYPSYDVSIGPLNSDDVRPGIDPDNDVDIDRLGQSFDGKVNYLSGWFDAAVRKTLHTEDMVRRGFNAAAAPDTRIDEILAVQNKNRKAAGVKL